MVSSSLHIRRWILSVLLIASFGIVTASAQNSIVVGVVMPTTGREAKPGLYQKEGIELAIKQINAKGGITVKGKKLQVKEVFYDDGSDSAKSASLCERVMSSDKATAVLGGYSTALGEAESVMPDRYKIPWITPGAAATSIFSRGYKYTFGALSPILLLGETTAEFLGSMVDQGKLKKGLKIALVVENTDHGADYVNGIQGWISKHPGYFTVVLNEKFELGGTDFSGLLQKVKTAHADIFLSDAHLQDYITMQRQYLQAGLHHQVVSYGARGPESDARKALGAGTDYILAALWWSDKLPYPQAKKFVDEYKAEYGRPPDSWYAAIAYDAMRILAQAIEAAGSTDGTAIRNALAKAQLKNSLVPGQVLKFGSNGQTDYPFLVTQNKPGDKVDIVYPKDAATGSPIVPRP
ncbi:MAG TPA: amino acid ABC transporter substrate-binding protein [Candidatus Acidoferrales bacterium]|jgi:branched-chain amino acid transport system substrate-binding protein|nr:amino acid ABC transporter substrate-binding protein [Candidatus Acidoferrales bacterium]